MHVTAITGIMWGWDGTAGVTAVRPVKCHADLGRVSLTGSVLID
jgi:hypothetical protein